MSQLLEDAWAAGFLDGEGCFGVYSYNSSDGHCGPGRVGWTAHIRVNQLVRSPLERLEELYGGVIKRRRARVRPVWQWTLMSLEDLDECLVAVIPHLILKKEQAELLLRYCREAGLNGRRTLPPEVLNLRYEIAAAMKAAKLVGT